MQNTLSIGDVIGLLIQSADVPWETLPPRLLSVFDKHRPTLHMNAGFTLQGIGEGNGTATVKVTLPAGFDFKPGSAQLQIGDGGSASFGDPTIDTQANTLTWTVPNVPFNTASTISFDTWSGGSVGPTQAAETVTSGGLTGSGTVPFSVTDSFNNNTPASAATITPDTNVEMSAIASAGEVDYYQIPMPRGGNAPAGAPDEPLGRLRPRALLADDDPSEPEPPPSPARRSRTERSPTSRSTSRAAARTHS